MVRHLLPGVVIGLSCAATAFAADRSPTRLDVRPVVLTVAMAGGCRTNDTVVALAQSEATRVWSHADVTLRWVSVSELPYRASLSEWVLVRCSDAHSGAAQEPKIPIAAIRFVGGLPTNTIAVSIENAQTLLRREARERDPRTRFKPFLDIGLGRMLGRAIAHEIGHFLTQSGEHTRSGLMRATHTVAALTGTSLRPFKVDDPPDDGVSQY